jgi:hypothetical protein
MREEVRDFDFIHSAEDVPELLGLASDLGLIIRRDEPSREPVPDIVDPAVIPELREGVFMTFLPHWVFGDLGYNLIDAGYRKGLYSQMPSTNCVNLNFYFGKETPEIGFIRLGSGTMSRDIRWYRPEDHTVHPAPLDVKNMFDRIRNEIDTRKFIEVGGRRYTILHGALEKLKIGSHRLSFDFMDAEPIHGLVSQSKP